MTRFIFPAPRARNIRCGFALAVALTAASGRAWPQSAGADLRGIWMAEDNADANLERAHVIVDPPDGKIPYRPEAAAQQKQNFRESGDCRSGSKDASNPECRALRICDRLFRFSRTTAPSTSFIRMLIRTGSST